MPAGKTLAANEKPLASDINTMMQWGVAASIPATADVTAGGFYWETDTNLLKQENGGSWITLIGFGDG